MARRGAGPDAPRGPHRSAGRSGLQPARPVLRRDHHLGVLPGRPVGALALDRRPRVDRAAGPSGARSTGMARSLHRVRWRRLPLLRTRSEDGNANQGWKDSGEAIVDAEGRLVRAPIATCEEQGFVYAAKLQLAEVLWWLDCRDQAKNLFHQASELKQRFNGAFWMEEEGFYAMGLDSRRQPDPLDRLDAGHCLATGIIDSERARAVADRLMEPDLWSGWGVRTLSSANPAYNPYSYHRGSVWPVENATFAIGFFRFGLWDHLDRLAKAMFEAAALYDYGRLPELYAGHQRDADHPFPANYARPTGRRRGRRPACSVWCRRCSASIPTRRCGCCCSTRTCRSGCRR